jgi:hypothetical protein
MATVWPDNGLGPGRDLRRDVPPAEAQRWPFARDKMRFGTPVSEDEAEHEVGRCDACGPSVRHTPVEAAQLNRSVPVVKPRPDDKVVRSSSAGRRQDGRFDYAGLAVHRAAPGPGVSVRELLGLEHFEDEAG